MKNLKRLIALVAVFALALTTIASAATYSDVADDSIYYEAVETLTKLGIIDGYTDGTFKPEQTVTRAEMAKLIATMQGFGAQAEGGAVTKFSDVPANYWASGYIANATGTAIDGYPDGTFGPDQNVKYEDAVKMIMATLGYTVIAKKEGGYPMGYVSAAIKADVTAGVKGTVVGKEATRGTIAQLIYNAIDTPLVEQITWDEEGLGDYIKFDGETKYGWGVATYKTLMSEYLGVVKMKGIVASNEYMDIDGYIAIDKNAVGRTDIYVSGDFGANTTWTEGLNDTNQYREDTFYIGDSDVSDFVGKAVIFFVHENEYDEWEVISVAEDKTYNQSVTFTLENYSADTDPAKDKLCYTKENTKRSTSLNIEDNVRVLYNNAYYGGDAYALIESLANGNYGGQVTVVDANKTSGYDLIVIEAAVSAVVDEVKGDKISLKNGIRLPNGGTMTKIDTDDEASIVVLMKDGEEITADELNEKDVLSVVAAVKNEGYIVIDVISNIVEGKITSVKDSDVSDTGKQYKIDGNWYNVATGADIGSAVLDNQSEGAFYIDKYGKIAYYDESYSGATGNYAYILETYLKVNDWDELSLQIRALTKDGVKVYEATNSFKWGKDKVELADLVAGTDYTVAVENGKTVITPATGEELESAINALENNVVDLSVSDNTFKGFVDYIQDKFEALNRTIEGEVDTDSFSIGRTDFNEDTMIFFVNTVDPKESFVGTFADLENEQELANQGLAWFDRQNKADANILVLFNEALITTEVNGLAVVTGFEESSDAKDDSIYNLTVLYKGEEVTYATTTDVYDDIRMFYDLANDETLIGDIVKIKVNGAGLITAFNTVVDFADEDIKNNADLTDITWIDPTYFDVDTDGDGQNDKERYFLLNLPNGLDFNDVDENDPGYDSSLVYGGAGFEIGKYNSNGKRVTLFDATTSFKLSSCKNIYVIDANYKDTVIEVGSTADFSFDKTLINNAGTGLAQNNVWTNKGEERSVYAAFDVVIIRQYDDKEAEAVIIKGLDDYNNEAPAPTPTPTPDPEDGEGEGE